MINILNKKIKLKMCNIKNLWNKNQMSSKKMMKFGHNKLKTKFKMSIKRDMRYKKLINNLKMVNNNHYQVMIWTNRFNNIKNLMIKKQMN